MAKDSVPAPCIKMDRMVSIEEAGISIIEVPLKRAAPESLQGLGRIVTPFEEAEVDIETWPAQGWRPVETRDKKRGWNHHRPV